MKIARLLKAKARTTIAIGIAATCGLFPLVATAQSETDLPYEAELANLGHQDAAVRIQALLDIAGYGDEAEAGVPEIITVLADRNNEVRLTAVQALGIIGPVASVASLSLAELLDDPAFIILSSTDNTLEYQSLAVATARTLGYIGPGASAALPALVEGLQTEDEPLKEAIIEALGNIGVGAPVVTKALFDQLRNGSALVSFRAAYALGLLEPVGPKTKAVLKRALEDTRPASRFLPSKAWADGEVREAAAEALFFISDNAKWIVKAAGGRVLDDEKEPPALPWKANLRLNFNVEGRDVRHVLAAILRANGMQAAFRHDVGGRLNFNFRQMPMAGAFNMLLNEYEMTYLYDPDQKLVRVVPLEAVVFPGSKRSPRARPAVAQTAARALAKPAAKPAARPTVVKPKKVAILPKFKPPLKVAKVEEKVTTPVQRTPEPVKPVAAPKVEKAPVVIAKKAPDPVLPATPEPPRAPEPPTAPEPTKKIVIQPSKPAPVAVAPAAPAAPAVTVAPAAESVDEVVDLSEAHRLSFVVQAEGKYYATIDGEEYAVGFPLQSKVGTLMVVGIGSRSVNLEQQTASGAKKFVIKFRRRSKRKKKKS